MRKAIATVSLSGLLSEKIDAIAAAGFDGLELFDNDLVASPMSPREVAQRCADLGLTLDLFQPVRDVEGVPPDRFEQQVMHRFRTKLGVMAELGAIRLLACSNVSADAVDDPDLAAEQLARLGDLAAEQGMSIAFEALAWGRHVHRVGQAWDVVRRADHPAVTLAVDTFHILSRGDDGSALTGIPGDRIGFLQVADAPLLDMNVLDWSRHFRCFPGEGGLDVAGVVTATVAAGYAGPLSLEVFSDVVRAADPATTSRDALRSLVYLEDLVARSLPGQLDPLESQPVQLTVQPPAPARVDTAFLEITGAAGVPPLLSSLGFTVVGRHRSKPVTWWRSRDAHVVVNDDPTAGPAIGVVATPIGAVSDRARAMLWPGVAHKRGAGEARLPGITSPSGLHVFLSAGRGDADDWQGDFDRTDGVRPGADACGPDSLDHIVVAVPDLGLNEEVSFLRTVLALEPGELEEFIEPQGRLRSRAFRPCAGDLRVVLNVEEVADEASAGITQVAFACSDVRAQVRALRASGVPLMPVPDNYYRDLDARFALHPDVLADLSEHQLLYDRVGNGELMHAFTDPLDVGFHVELLERRGGYDGFGSAGTHVRLATQRAARATESARPLSGVTELKTSTPLRAVDPDDQTASQADIDAEMAAIARAYADTPVARAAGETQPRRDYPPYRSSLLRHPTKSLHQVDPEGAELWAPVFGERDLAGVEADLTVQHEGEPVGERMRVTGRVLDGEGRAVRGQLVEIWQANAAGRYIHQRDQHPAPLDPHFTGMGRCLTDEDGWYTFTTIKPGPYPWRNHHNAWRPAHIHFSLFGIDFTQRLVTQMYFPGDPLFALDPIYQAILDPRARERLVATYDHDFSKPEWATGYRWDIVLTGSARTPVEEDS